MRDAEAGQHDGGIVLEYEFRETPQKVWRAISLPEFREAWLPGTDLADPEAVAATPGQEIRYRMRDGTPPFLESVVTFRISANAAGGTTLRILHDLSDARIVGAAPLAANDDGAPVMLAA